MSFTDGQGVVLPATTIAPTAPRAAAPVPALACRPASWRRAFALLAAAGADGRRWARYDADELENRLGTELMARFRDTRDDAVFDALYDFAGPSVLRWIRGLLRRGQAHLDPAELLQDTFVNVYRYPRSFRADHAGSFRVWVRTIAGNIVRRSCIRRASMSLQELPEGLREPTDPGANPELCAVLDEQRERLRSAWLLYLLHYASAWTRLGPRDRQALELVEVEGFSYEEAGRVLGVRRSNMKMIIFRARKRIAARMRGRMKT